MIQRARVVLTAVGLPLLLMGSCVGSPSSSTADAGAGERDALSGDPSSATTGGLDGATEDSGVELGIAGDAAGDSGSLNVRDAGAEDAGADITVADAGIDEADAVAVADGAAQDSRSQPSGSDGGGDADGPVVDTGSSEGAPGQAEAGVDAGCVNLTVLNYEIWCAVTVNGGAAYVDASDVVCVPPGTHQLAATALLDFELGPAPWHDTTGDTGQGDPGVVTGSGESAIDSTTVVVGDAPACVWVCCPFNDGDGCPTADQCP